MAVRVLYNSVEPMMKMTLTLWIVIMRWIMGLMTYLLTMLCDVSDEGASMGMKTHKYKKARASRLKGQHSEFEAQ